MQIDGVLDIETEQWDQYVLGALLDDTGRYVETRNEDELWEAVADLAVKRFESGTELWAHNGGRFDWLWWLEGARRRNLNCQISLAGSRVSRIACPSLGLTLRDSAALVPMRLDDFLQMIGETKAETGLPCVCEDRFDPYLNVWKKSDCGGYCSIRRDMPEADFCKLGAYLRQDCAGLVAALEFLFTFAADHGIILTGTVGGTAWKTARAELDLDLAEWRTAGHYYRAAEGDYGGRCEVYRPAASAGYRYDINSAYPAALAELELPVGPYQVVAERKAARAYGSGIEGIYTATVEVRRDEHIPPLPWRWHESLAFPVGQFTGAWTALELRAAEEAGAKIQNISTAIVWWDSANLLAPFCERIFALRAAAGKKSGIGKWLKWLPNSFSGKVSQDPEGEHVELWPDPNKIKSCPGTDPCSHEACTGRCGAWELICPSGAIWRARHWRIPECGHVHWGAYTRAFVRVEARAELLADDQGGKTGVYLDTDGIRTTAPRTRNVGNELGQWHDDGEYDDFVSVAPKNYREKDRATGEVVARAKGLADIDPILWEAFRRGEVVPMDKGVRTFLSAARSGGSLFARRDLARQSHADGMRFGSRFLHDGQDWTSPVDCDTFRAWHPHESRSRRTR